MGGLAIFNIENMISISCRILSHGLKVVNTAEEIEREQSDPEEENCLCYFSQS